MSKDIGIFLCIDGVVYSTYNIFRHAAFAEKSNNTLLPTHKMCVCVCWYGRHQLPFAKRTQTNFDNKLSQGFRSLGAR